MRKVFFPSFDYILNAPYRSDAFWKAISPEEILNDDNMLWYESWTHKTEGLKCYSWLVALNLYSSGEVEVRDKNGNKVKIEITTAHGSEQEAALNLQDEFACLGYKGLDIKPKLIKEKNLTPSDLEQDNALFSISYHKNEKEKALFLLDFYTKYSYMIGIEPSWENDIFEVTSFPGYCHKLR